MELSGTPFYTTRIPKQGPDRPHLDSFLHGGGIEEGILGVYDESDGGPKLDSREGGLRLGLCDKAVGHSTLLWPAMHANQRDPHTTNSHASNYNRRAVPANPPAPNLSVL